MSTPNTIVLKGKYVAQEGRAGAAFTPGYLVERYVSGGVELLRKHATADGAAQKNFALENEWVGKGIDTAYATDDRARYGTFEKGAVVYALLAASATAVANGDPVGSAGDGTLKKITVGASTLEGALVGWAKEAVDNSSGVTEARIRIEIA